MKILEHLFGPRIDEDPEAEEEKAQELQDTLVKHKATLNAVGQVLSESQMRVVVAIDETGDAIERMRSHRHDAP